MKPVIALVGRPNVGKSTLFNRLTSTRDAIVADFAGLTRDRHYGNGRQGAREYIVIDTGGFEPDATDGIYKEMAKQTRQAVAESDVVIFVVDAFKAVAMFLTSGFLRGMMFLTVTVMFSSLLNLGHGQHDGWCCWRKCCGCYRVHGHIGAVASKCHLYIVIGSQ